MKKAIWITCSLIVAALVLTIYLILRPSVEKLTLDDQADLLLLTDKGISSLTIRDNDLAITKTSLTNLSYVQEIDKKGTDGRYFVFSETDANYVMSLDLKEGRLYRQPVNSYELGLAVNGQKGAYSLVGNELVAYDKLGHERQRMSLGDEEDYFYDAQLVLNNGLIYVINHVLSNDQSTGSDHFYLTIIDESNFTIVDHISIPDISIASGGGILDAIIVGNDLYYLVVNLETVLTEEGSAYVKSRLLQKINLTTFESSSLPIDKESPDFLYPLANDGRLLIEHSHYENDLKLLTAIDLKTGEQEVFNLSEDLQLGDSMSNLQSIVALDDQRLVILTQVSYSDSKQEPASLYLYDMDNKKVLSQLTLEDENSVGLLSIPKK